MSTQAWQSCHSDQGEIFHTVRHSELDIFQYNSLTSLDSDALDLARRLGGLPLALATAGTYLSRTDISCDEYLELYNSVWMDLVGADTEELLEYEARTMSSTWNISLDQVRSQNGDAAELLKFLAYLNNRDIWYDLMRAAAL